MKLTSVLVLLCLVSIGIFAQSYTTIVANGRQSDFPQRGFFAYSNAFPEGTRLILRNPDTNAKTTVTILSPIGSTGGAMLVSPEAAVTLGIISPSIIQVEQDDTSSVAALERALVQNPDLNPALSFQNSLPSEEDQPITDPEPPSDVEVSVDTDPPLSVPDDIDPPPSVPEDPILPPEEESLIAELPSEGFFDGNESDTPANLLALPEIPEEEEPEFNIQELGSEEQAELFSLPQPQPLEDDLLAEVPVVEEIIEEPSLRPELFEESIPDFVELLEPTLEEIVPDILEADVSDEVILAADLELPEEAILATDLELPEELPLEDSLPEPDSTDFILPPEELAVAPDREEQEEIFDDTPDSVLPEIDNVVVDEEDSPPDSIASSSTIEVDADYIQVGAFSDLLSAQEIRSSLSSLYDTSIVDKDSIKLVVVGPVLDDEKGVLLYTLRNIGYPDAFIKNASEF